MISRFRKKPGPREIRKRKRPATPPPASTPEQPQDEMLIELQNVATNGRPRRMTRTQRLAFGLGL
jgi:hypothetical protein